MKACLLCERILMDVPSWQSFLSIEKQEVICVECSSLFERTDIKNKHTTIDKMAVNQITSLYTYNEAMKNYLHQFKFLQDVALASVFARELKRVLPNDGIIVPIPMHPEKKIERTFAHVEEMLIAAKVSYVNILEKLDRTAMGEKSKAERLASEPLFKVKDEEMIEPKRYVLVDDIYTTGTTLHHAANVLKETGATSVEAITLIRA